MMARVRYTKNVLTSWIFTSEGSWNRVLTASLDKIFIPRLFVIKINTLLSLLTYDIIKSINMSYEFITKNVLLSWIFTIKGHEIEH